MREVLKLTGIAGETFYVQNGYAINAITSRKDGDLIYTEIHMPGIAFRVKEPVETVAELLGWEPKRIEPATAKTEGAKL